MKGLVAPLRVAVLEGTGAARTRLDVSRTRGLSRFVGGTDELATLAHALAGRGQVVGIVVEPGTGKSRLCPELSARGHRGHEREPRVHSARPRADKAFKGADRG